MKIIGIGFVLGIALLLSSCGNTSNGNINGNWTAALLSSNQGGPTFDFTTNLSETSGGGLSITNLTFTTSSPCFSARTNATGGFTLSGNQNGVTSGGFEMNIQSTASGTNVLSLQGTVRNNTITGQWTLTGTGPGCIGSGQFTMNKS